MDEICETSEASDFIERYVKPHSTIVDGQNGVDSDFTLNLSNNDTHVLHRLCSLTLDHIHDALGHAKDKNHKEVFHDAHNLLVCTGGIESMGEYLIFELSKDGRLDDAVPLHDMSWGLLFSMVEIGNWNIVVHILSDMFIFVEIMYKELERRMLLESEKNV